MTTDSILLYKQFQKYQSNLINLFIEYYGKEYESIISNKLTDTYYNFSSSPLADFKFLESNKDSISSNEKKYIKQNLKQYRTASFFIRLKLYYLFHCFIKKELKHSSLLPTNTFLSIFTSPEFDKSLIDYYNSHTTRVINEQLLSSAQIDLLRKKRNTIYQQLLNYNIDIEKVDPKVIDRIICYRDSLKKIYMNCITQNTNYAHSFYIDIKRLYDIGLNNDILQAISNIDNSYSGTITIKDNQSTMYIYYIRIPLIHLHNIGFRGHDVNLIHELIHRIENNRGECGIDNDSYNTMVFNEIRTQRIAIKLTRKLHNQGIYIFDNPQEFNIEKESIYEVFFPLIDEFLEQYESLISKCAIENNSEEILTLFGPSYITFNEYLTKIYRDLTSCYTSQSVCCLIRQDEYIQSLINSMDNYHHKLLKKTY